MHKISKQQKCYFHWNPNKHKENALIFNATENKIFHQYTFAVSINMSLISTNALEDH